MYTWFILAYLLCMILSVEIFCPIYQKFGVTSVYEYLEFRYGLSLRKNLKKINKLADFNCLA